jgi:alkane 1-monooxygenase
MSPATEAYRCPGCGYTYLTAQGAPHEGFAPGTPWSAIPENWACPDCAVREKPDFIAIPNSAQVVPSTP